MQRHPSDSVPAPDPHNHSFPLKWTPEMALCCCPPVFVCPIKNSARPNVKFLSIVLRERTECQVLHPSHEKIQLQVRILHLQVQLCSHFAIQAFPLIGRFSQHQEPRFFSSSSKAQPLTNSTDQTFAILVYIR